MSVPYDTRYGEATSMDVYVPEGDGPFPAVMFIHGGAWIAGDRGEFTEAARRLARSGYVAATIDYRLAPGTRYPGPVQDCVCALSYLRKHAADYKLDPGRVAVMGYSAGGNLAALVGTSADIEAHQPTCDAGPTGLPRAVIASGTGYDERDVESPFHEDLFGGTPDEVPERYAGGSPITHVRPGLPPFLLVAATADVGPSIERQRAMRDALAAQGNHVEMLEIDGGGHVTQASGGPGHWTVEEADLTQEAWILLQDFLDREVAR